MRLEFIDGLRIIIIALLAYVPTVTISGWFEAWVAKKSGDDVPEQFGFLTLDPIVHFNVVGFAILLIGQLFGEYLPFFKDLPGWGRYIPLNPSEASRGKILLEFTARAIAHFVMLLISFFILVGLMKTAYLQSAGNIIQTNSSIIQSISSVLLFFYRQNFMLCIIYSVIGLFRALLFYYFPQFHLFSSQHIISALLLLILFVIIGSQIFEALLSSLMALLSYLLMVQ
ncbi:hypothetical protein A3J41_01865 [candidate division TM6 bacterium RIFCSPHIGHO2_12_FULL_38_8]|nr:MAG: hypothetical protein A3J41_01865 [candidate division TM6 bacterium RIFCSPHIGHO2_12_FULL_38_8]